MSVAQRTLLIVAALLGLLLALWLGVLGWTRYDEKRQYVYWDAKRKSELQLGMTLAQVNEWLGAQNLQIVPQAEVQTIVKIQEWKSYVPWCSNDILFLTLQFDADELLKYTDVYNAGYCLLPFLG